MTTMATGAFQDVEKIAYPLTLSKKFILQLTFRMIYEPTLLLVVLPFFSSSINYIQILLYLSDNHLIGSLSIWNLCLEKMRLQRNKTFRQEKLSPTIRHKKLPQTMSIEVPFHASSRSFYTY